MLMLMSLLMGNGLIAQVVCFFFLVFSYLFFLSGTETESGPESESKSESWVQEFVALPESETGTGTETGPESVL